MMEFEEEANVKPADSVMHYEGFKLVCDAKSLLYLFGMSLDYSNALIGEIDLAHLCWLAWPDNAELRSGCSGSSCMGSTEVCALAEHDPPLFAGGGFQFQNPNAQDSCGCGKSFGV